MTTDATGLTQLGAPTPIPADPAAARLERVPNPHPDALYLARFTAPEFTSICPVTSQPDFGHLVIDYAPQDWLVESKSLKLYLWSFRDRPVFAEALAAEIAFLIASTSLLPSCTVSPCQPQAS